MREAVVFVGPTLPRDCLEGLLGDVAPRFRILPPVSQGDIASLVRHRPRLIGIVDGYFDRLPAVWHKEILWAMSQGVHVFGAASMGALRAAELAAFGMRGVGEVFEEFHGGRLADDDEVAVTHAAAEEGFRPTSVALVDMRATWRAAHSQGLIDDAGQRLLVAAGQALFYPHRDYETVLRSAIEEGLAPAVAEALTAWLPRGRVEQKRRDAEAMVRSMVDLLRRGFEAMEVRFAFNATSSWRDLERSLAMPRPLDDRPGAETLPEEAVLDELRLAGLPYRQARQQAMDRILALEVASLHGLEVGRGASALLQLRRRLGLEDDTAWQHWLQDQGVTLSDMRRLAADDVRVEKVHAYAADHLSSQMIDLLRRRGRLAGLCRRARQKEEILARRGLSRVELRELGPPDEELWHWYFVENLAGEVPQDLVAYARDHDFTHVAELRWTVLRERLARDALDGELSHDS